MPKSSDPKLWKETDLASENQVLLSAQSSHCGKPEPETVNL